MRLCSIFQRYKSKAIHNELGSYVMLPTAVFNLSKIQIESNSQLLLLYILLEIGCVQSFKDTNRKQFTTKTYNAIKIILLCSIFQRYKSKAIHNFVWCFSSFKKAVFNLSKIQIESNSQLVGWCFVFTLSCVQSFKDTNRKQFTTPFACFRRWC